MTPRYKVVLTEAERAILTDISRKGQTEARKYTIARVLLLCDTGEFGPAWKVAKVAEAVGITSEITEWSKMGSTSSSMLSTLSNLSQMAAVLAKNRNF